MQTTDTGDQSGGLWRRDGGSTPAKSGQRPTAHTGGELDKTEEATDYRPAQSTDDKNSDQAFNQVSREVEKIDRSI
jgi:hypothetical protein